MAKRQRVQKRQRARQLLAHLALDPERLMRPREVAAFLGVARRTLEVMRNRGEFPPHVRLTAGGRSSPIAWVRSDVLRWIESRRTVTSAESPAEPVGPEAR